MSVLQPVPTSRMITIRAAAPADASLISELIAELALFEKESDQVRTTAADIFRDGFARDPQFRTFIAEWNTQPAGYALFFSYYSSWRGAGLYLEDLFVRPSYRGRGIGTALLARVARTAEMEKRTFLRWSVLDWNQPAQELYRSVGAGFLDRWRTVVLTGESFSRLAAKDM
jgi:GNAT superfamily N-acetyltransferase